jgi:hypothetical protein
MRRMVPRRRLLMTSLFIAISGACYVTAIPASAAAPTSPAAAQTWFQSVSAELSPLQSSLIGGLQAESSWQIGHETSVKVRRQMDLDLPVLKSALADLSDLAPLPGFPEAKANFVDGVSLYVQSFSVIRAATFVRSAPMVKQLQRASTRIRELGDVTFDQGTAEIADLLGSSGLAGDDVQAATQIPDWSAEGLAPAAPLISQWKGTPSQPTRNQSATAWAVAIKRSGAPSQGSIGDAVSGRSSVSKALLARLANELDRAEVFLSGSPGLTGYPQASALLRLALLVDAEAALARDAATQCQSTPAKVLNGAASVLAWVGGTMRPEQ